MQRWSLALNQQLQEGAANASEGKGKGAGGKAASADGSSAMMTSAAAWDGCQAHVLSVLQDAWLTHGSVAVEEAAPLAVAAACAAGLLPEGEQAVLLQQLLSQASKLGPS